MQPATTTTVRIKEEDRERLRRLSEAWRRRRGETTHQELLSAALGYVEARLDDFLAAGAWRPLRAADVEALEARAVDPRGWRGSAADLDDVVYG